MRPRGRDVAVGAWLALALGVAYRGTAEFLWMRWNAPQSLYGHGPFVVAVCIWLLWRSRAVWSEPARGSWLGVGLGAGALAVHLAGAMFRIDSLSVLSLLALGPAVVWATRGFKALRATWFPFAFFGFALPPPLLLVDEAALQLKQLLITATVAALQVAGIGVEAEGSILRLDGVEGRLLVDDECSGLRSLVALIALGALMAGTSRGGWKGRVTLLLLAVPIALVANGARVVVLCLLARWRGVEMARSWHDPSGWGVYAVAILAYLGLEAWCSRTRASRAVGAAT